MAELSLRHLEKVYDNKVKAVYDNNQAYTVSKQVRLSGEKDWKEVLKEFYALMILIL